MELADFVLGAVLIWLILKLCQWVYQYVIQPCRFDGAKFLSRYGGNGMWAVITGSTAGIGEAFAYQLAQMGFNIVLIGRNPAKLKHVARMIRRARQHNNNNNNQHNNNTNSAGDDIQIEAMVIDFKAVNSQDWTQRICASLQRITNGKITLLINNVGMNQEGAQRLHAISDRSIDDIVAVNCLSATRLSRVVIPIMLRHRRDSNSGNNKYGIINIASVAGIFPTPLLGIYSATKAFVHSFSQTLSEEYRDYDIHVLSATPAIVDTALARKVFVLPGSLPNSDSSWSTSFSLASSTLSTNHIAEDDQQHNTSDIRLQFQDLPDDNSAMIENKSAANNDYSLADDESFALTRHSNSQDDDEYAKSYRDAQETSCCFKPCSFPPVIRPPDCAWWILTGLGHTRHTYGHWRHAVQAAFMNLIPSSLLMMTSQAMMDEHRRRIHG